LATPKLSVVIAGSSQHSTTRAAIEALGAGVRQGTIEVLVSTAGPQATFDDLGRVRVLPSRAGTIVPRLRSVGLAAAKAEIVALTEDFCVPTTAWADALLATHNAVDAIAIGGPMSRRQGSPTEWALTFQEYGRFFRHAPEGPVDDLPGTNVSYKAARLRTLLSDELAEIEEIVVHGRLRSAGEVLWRAPRAVMYDVSRSRFRSAMRSLYHHGRLFGGRPPAGPRRLARLPFALMAPAAQLVRIVAGTVPAGHGTRLVRTLPTLVPMLLAWAAGETVGAALGAGDSRGRWT